MAAEAEENEVVPRENCVDDLRHDGLLVAEDAGEQRAALTEPLEKVLPHLVLDGAERALGNTVRGLLEGAKGLGMRLHVTSPGYRLEPTLKMKATDAGGRKPHALVRGFSS